MWPKRRAKHSSPKRAHCNPEFAAASKPADTHEPGKSATTVSITAAKHESGDDSDDVGILDVVPDPAPRRGRPPKPKPGVKPQETLSRAEKQRLIDSGNVIDLLGVLSPDAVIAEVTSAANTKRPRMCDPDYSVAR